MEDEGKGREERETDHGINEVDESASLVLLVQRQRRHIREEDRPVRRADGQIVGCPECLFDDRERARATLSAGVQEDGGGRKLLTFSHRSTKVKWATREDGGSPAAPVCRAITKGRL